MDDDFPVKDKSKANRISKRNSKLKTKTDEILSGLNNKPFSKDHMKEYVHKNIDHLKSCSCWMCTNPRRVFKGKSKLTIQERKAKQEDE